jgi:16S rRNA (adenine1518-N6/adenine1519-N6)-dimethyltransferase
MPDSTSRLQDLKAMLAERGFAPQKRLGQNFMIDGNFAAAIARDAALDERTLVLEIGPGTGFLTRALLAAHPSTRIFAVELDRGLAGYLADAFADEIASGRLALLQGDVLAGKHRFSEEVIRNTHELCRAEHRTRRILCSNLPYNIAAPVLANLAEGVDGLEVDSAVVTVQLESAERILAKAGEKAYCALSILFALRTRAEILRRVGQEIFWPRPQVDSAVVRLEFKPWDRNESGLASPDEARRFRLFLQKLFSQRRKTLKAVCKNADSFQRLRIPAAARAEDLPPETLLALFRALETDLGSS